MSETNTTHTASTELLPQLPDARDPRILAYLNLKLREIGQPTIALPDSDADHLAGLVDHLLTLSREKDRLLTRHFCPVDQRIQNYLYATFEEHGGAPRLPAQTLVLDRPGLARALSLPPSADEHKSPILSSYRLHNGVLHNPKSDRRTTKGIFHVTEGGLPIPDDKKAVPAAVFARLLRHAFNPPSELLQLPFTAGQATAAECFVSLYQRPVVVPEVAGFTPRRSMETRFFVPGSLVANLDFVESVFGNAGDPHLPANDAALDPEHWTGHTGCIILAPHLSASLTKKELGLPAWDDATDRQRRDGMAWKKPDELYNDGVAFKITSRDASGVIVTILSDNYFGYCKKEIKTHISYAANLLGSAEEEHSGGAIAFASYDLGENFRLTNLYPDNDYTLAGALTLLGANATPQPGGWARDNVYPDIYYIPESARFDLRTQSVIWSDSASEARPDLKLLPGITYIYPNGYRVEMVNPDRRRWRLRGSSPSGLLCHKPCTVSGGGKSEISKSIADATFSGPIFISDPVRDIELVRELLHKNYYGRYKDASRNTTPSRPILSPARSLGSVVKLLSRSPDYTDDYNAWLTTIPRYVRDIVLLVKRLYKPEWGEEWASNFSVDTINGRPGNEIKYHGIRATTQFLRIGYTATGGWRTFSLRSDFLPAIKIQVEDDITASTVAPLADVKGLPRFPERGGASVKLVHNCETRLFQRPDDAIIRGYDRHTEEDFAKPDTYFSNYEPLDHAAAAEIISDTLGFDAFTQPVRDLFKEFASHPRAAFLASPAHPRIVDGKPTKNPRYLQVRPDLLDPRATRVAHAAARLRRRLAADDPVTFPVGAVLMGRRLNPPEAGVRPLCVFNPIHYQELPEAFMDLIASLTGKSPSTTGAGSEGALTKGPFNALPPIYDLNSALVSFLLTDLPAFSTAAGWVGPKLRVDHDISLLVPEIWCRMTRPERDPKNLISKGYFERCQDFVHNGKPVLASRLGYRITARGVQTFFGRVLSNPSTVFDEEFLKPELQDMDVFAEGMANIVEAMKTAAESYFADGSIQDACPPLKALLHIMRDGTWEGHGPDAPEFRALFDREQMLKSDWYHARLEARRQIDAATWDEHARYLEKFLHKHNYADVALQLDIKSRLTRVTDHARAAARPDYLKKIRGTLGSEPAVAAGIVAARESTR
ncbi:hypothetical protein OpiT1DRAFT_01209 [Opitutaceae bacterium TAV1]|nr:hypothetical protein OpiT1DRAFT_01209 [Opitutaceae bacterium TAV1]